MKKTIFAWAIFLLFSWALVWTGMNSKRLIILNEIEKNNTIVDIDGIAISKSNGMEKWLDIKDGRLIVSIPSGDSSEEHKTAYREIEEHLRAREAFGE